MQIWNVRAPDNLANWSALFVISNCAVERVIGAHIKFRLRTKKSGQTRLGIEINSEHAISMKSQILDRCAAVVVFPDPPLKFMTVMICRCSPALDEADICDHPERLDREFDVCFEYPRPNRIDVRL